MMHFVIIASIDFEQIAYTVVIFALVGGILFIIDLFFRRSRKKKKSASAKAFEQQLRQPKFEELEKHFGRAFPQDLKALYNNPDEIGRENFQVITKSGSGKETFWDIAYYQPANLEQVIDGEVEAREVFEFANDGCGNGYTIDPMLDDPPVMFHDHETAKSKKVTDTLSQFMSLPRRPRKISS